MPKRFGPPRRDVGLKDPIGILELDRFSEATLKRRVRDQLLAAILPVQFGLPAPTHIVAELLRAAEIEAILYRSTKSGGDCLAIFPDKLAPGSYVELADAPPPAVRHTRLDEASAQDLCGWEAMPRQFRPLDPR